MTRAKDFLIFLVPRSVIVRHVPSRFIDEVTSINRLIKESKQTGEKVPHPIRICNTHMTAIILFTRPCRLLYHQSSVEFYGPVFQMHQQRLQIHHHLLLIS